MLRFIIRKTGYAYVLLRTGGFRELLCELRKLIFSKHRLVCLGRDIEGYGKGPVECSIGYYFRQATEEDMNEVFRQVETEGRDSAQTLLKSKLLYECGCGDWFVVRTNETDAPCYFQCVVRPEDNSVVEKYFKGWFSRIKADEIILESAYTFKNYRGNRIAPSFVAHLMKIYRNKGYERVKIYIEKDREAQLIRTEEGGFRRLEELSLLKILFFTIKRLRPYQPVYV